MSYRLPARWESLPISDVVVPCATRNPASDGEGEFQYVDVDALDNTRQIIANPKTISRSNAPSRARLAIREGDVLFSLVRPYLMNIAIVPRELDGEIASTAYCILRPNSKASSKFLFYQLIQEAFIHAIPTYGTSPPAARDYEFKALHIHVAPPPEQERIVAKIEELFSDLDAGVAALERAKAKLKRYRAAVLKAAVEGRLTEAWRKEHPDTEAAERLLERILIERRQLWEAEQLRKYTAAGKTPPKDWQNKYQEPQPPDTTKLPELPKGWCWATVDQVADVGTGSTPTRTNALFYDGGNIPWLTSTVVNEPYVSSSSEFVTTLATKEFRLRVYPVNTLVVALYGEGKTRGKISELLLPATINQALGALVLHGAATAIRPYLKAFFNANYLRLREKSSGGVQPNLNLGLICKTTLPMPPQAEQSEITMELERCLSIIDAAEKEIERGLQRAARLRQSILKHAFEGRLV